MGGTELICYPINFTFSPQRFCIFFFSMRMAELGKSSQAALSILKICKFD